MKKSWVIIGLIILLSYLYYQTESARATNGINSYLSNLGLISQSSFFYIMLFGLVSGFIIAKILGGKK